jgi:hypothetical protein
VQAQSVSDKARNALGLLAARYTGETGFPARDIGALQQYTGAVTAALDEGDAAIAKLAELEAKIAKPART